MFHIILRQPKFFRGARFYTIFGKEKRNCSWSLNQRARIPWRTQQLCPRGKQKQERDILERKKIENWNLSYCLIFPPGTWGEHGVCGPANTRTSRWGRPEGRTGLLPWHLVRSLALQTKIHDCLRTQIPSTQVELFSRNSNIFLLGWVSGWKF